MQHIELPGDYALVLQTVHENGEEDFANLAETLRFDRRRLTHIIDALRSKGLIYLKSTTSPIGRTSNDAWIRLSAKGRKFVGSVWPESVSPTGLAYGY